jgi:nicotinamidase-related amidase
MKKSSGRGAALLLVDFMNPLDFPGSAELAPRAVRAARQAARLKERSRRAKVPCIYANDHFGHWDADFRQVIDGCLARGGASRAIADALAPHSDDYSVLKPRHSAFFGTPLEFLLDELHVDRLILAGLVTESCVLFTAHDAYLRKYPLWVPADCSASQTPRRHRGALDHMSDILKADVRSSSIGIASAFSRNQAPHRVPRGL